MKFLQIEGEHLLSCENVLVSSLSKLKADFVVLHGHYFVCDKSLLELQLGLALHVEAEETSREHDSVLEVSLRLSLSRITNDALLRSVSDCNTTQFSNISQLVCQTTKFFRVNFSLTESDVQNPRSRRSQCLCAWSRPRLPCRIQGRFLDTLCSGYRLESAV